MNKTSATPSPLNLFTKLFQYIRLAYRHKGKLCSAQAQAYINEEDDIDALSDTRSMDILANSSAVWLQTIRRRRSAKITPDGVAGMVRSHHGPQRLEDAIEWKAVVKRYYKMQGVDESSDDDDEKNGILNHSNNNHIDALNDMQG
ncbi:uncharacterized protein LOC132718575 [Ruditapes philippinarum]|uniref:uncharacterized protein LOC132718575 n=1 Tax=Ruditapes philippinarum TaxID=129788 RepID=UPI00295ACFDB|nr:uncharacterized protein LOC132718575 [Ruditapes philippinarum]